MEEVSEIPRGNTFTLQKGTLRQNKSQTSYQHSTVISTSISCLPLAYPHTDRQIYRNWENIVLAALTLDVLLDFWGGSYFCCL